LPEPQQETDTLVGGAVEPEVTLFTRTLMAQHDRLRTLMDAVTAGRGRRRDDAFDEFRRSLAAHEAAERLAMHPLFLGLDRSDTSILERLAEEDRIAELVTGLEEYRERDVAEFERGFEQVRTALEAHVDLEERDELMGYLHRITVDDAGELLAVLERVDELGHSAEELAADTPFTTMLEECEAELDRRLGR
jgi:hypothetical protein